MGKNNNSKLPYVINRVTKINEMQSDFCFQYVDTKSNPADMLSRGVTTKNLCNNTLWFLGPQWLRERDMWPQQKICPLTVIKNDEMNKDSEIDAPMFMDKVNSLC